MGWSELNFALGSVFSLSAGLFVLYQRQSRRITQQTWFLLCLFTSIWYGGRLLIAVAETEAQAERAVYVIYMGAIFVSPFFLHFVLSLLNQEKEHRRFQIFWYLFAFVLVALLVGGQLTRGVHRYPDGGFYENPSSIYLLFFLYFISLPALAIIKLIIGYRQTKLPNRRNQLKYVIYASLIGFLGGGTSFLPFVDISVPPLGVPLSYCYTFIIAYAVGRYRLMDIDVVIKESLIYALLLLLLLVPSYLIVIWAQAATFGEIDYTFSMFILLLFVIIGFLYPKLRFRTEHALERVLFKKSYHYHNTLLRSSKDMLSVIDLNTLSEKLVNTVSKALGIEKASLFLSDEAKGNFDLKASVGLSQDQFEGHTLLKDDPLVQGLMENPEALIREELAMARNGQMTRDMAAKMAEMEAEVSVPLIAKEKLIGILNLGSKEEMYTNDDLDVLSMVANQVAIALENAQLYEDLKQSQKVLQRADRLSSLGLLTAGLAHEIRNPLVAIRTFTQLLPERYADPEFRDNFKSLALREVDRICGLVNDLLSFARPSTPKVSPENANEIVESIARILESEAKEKDVAIHLHLAPELPKIFIDKEQIKQVAMNVILNAIQSVEGQGEVEVSTRMFSKDSSERFLQIEVRDTGVGIEEGDLENIFNPFFTTKKDGNGLGLSISHQIIKEHGGYMVADSKPGEGTAFYINLPAQLSHRPISGMPGTNEKDMGH